MNEFSQRLITALLLVAATVAALYWLPTIAFEILTLLAATIATVELAKLTQQKSTMKWVLIAMLWAAGSLVIYSPESISITIPAAIGALFWLCMLAVMLCRLALMVIKPGLISSLIGVCIIFIAWFVLVSIRETEGPFRLLALLGLVWAADTGAYFSGKRFGKHKLAPTISPGKSIEGLIGGIAIGVVYVLILQVFGYKLVAWPIAIGLVIISVIGDLTESQLKRSANIKDSGSFLPGHGGFLDRTDSMISVLPCYLAVQSLLGA